MLKPPLDECEHFLSSKCKQVSLTRKDTTLPAIKFVINQIIKHDTGEFAANTFISLKKTMKEKDKIHGFYHIHDGIN